MYKILGVMIEMTSRMSVLTPLESHLLDMRWLMVWAIQSYAPCWLTVISYPTSTHGINIEHQKKIGINAPSIYSATKTNLIIHC